MNKHYSNYLLSKNIYTFPYIYMENEKEIYNTPENLTESEIKIIELELKKEPNNLFLLESYIIFHNNIGNLNIDKYFKKYLNIFGSNPYMLLRYSRYQGSALYKLNNDKKYLLLALKNTKNAINILEKSHKEKDIPTFIYSWLGLVYIEIGEYNEAIRNFNISIYLNKKYHNHEQSEPFLWKAIVFNKIGKYKNSQEIYNINIEKVKSKKINNKLDFRVYKVISDNYYNLLEYELFYFNLKITIKKFLNSFSFYFNENIKIDLKNSKINYFNYIEKNRYDTFFKYNKVYINDSIDEIILSIAFLYKEKILGNDILFNNSRGVEKLCYNYLQLIYEGRV